MPDPLYICHIVYMLIYSTWSIPVLFLQKVRILNTGSNVSTGNHAPLIGLTGTPEVLLVLAQLFLSQNLFSA
jgi:hypothetical protein